MLPWISASSIAWSELKYGRLMEFRSRILCGDHVTIRKWTRILEESFHVDEILDGLKDLLHSRPLSNGRSR